MIGRQRTRGAVIREVGKSQPSDCNASSGVKADPLAQGWWPGTESLAASTKSKMDGPHLVTAATAAYYQSCHIADLTLLEEKNVFRLH